MGSLLFKKAGCYPGRNRGRSREVFMNSIDEEKVFFKDLFTMLENHFGKELEIVLHDLTRNYDHSIIDIRNGEITKRKIGGTGDVLGLQVLRGTIVDGNSFNEIMYTEDHKTLRCSTIFLKNNKGKVIGSICINQDISKTVEFENYLHNLNKNSVTKPEIFPKDVNSLLRNLIVEAQLAVGRQVSTMTKNDKLDFIRYLDDHGAFLISKSGTKVCAYLQISKFTLYNYLDIIRGKTDDPPVSRAKHKGREKRA